MKTTVGDIARKAGVSRATVSAIISGGGTNISASEGMRRKVIKIADQLNYIPPTTHNIGVIHSVGKRDPKDIDWMSCIAPMLGSIHSEAVSLNNLVSVFAYSSWQLEKLFSSELPNIFKRKKIDGVIVSGILDEPLLACLEHSRLPYVLMNVDNSDLHAKNTISFDEVFTGAESTRYLMELGHRRILHVGVDWENPHYSVFQRREGYERVMKQMGETPRMAYHRYDDMEFIQEVVSLLQKSDRPTAIFAYNEFLALCCSRAITMAGLTYRDVSLLGVTWGNVRIMQGMGISYTKMPAAKMGAMAFETLLKKTRTKESGASVLLRGGIHSEQSTFPAPAELNEAVHTSATNSENTERNQKKSEVRTEKHRVPANKSLRDTSGRRKSMRTKRIC